MNPRSILFALAFLIVAVPAFAGPPWISIEIPSNPFDRRTRGAFLVVRTYHHGNPVALQLRGTMEGIAAGRRISRPIAFERTPVAGLSVLTTAVPSEGSWVLVVVAGDGDASATALVDVTSGAVRGIEVPHERGGEFPIPRAVAPAEIDARVEALAAAETSLLLAKPGHGLDPLVVILLGAGLGGVPIGALAIRRARRR